MHVHMNGYALYSQMAGGKINKDVANIIDARTYLKGYIARMLLMAASKHGKTSVI